MLRNGRSRSAGVQSSPFLYRESVLCDQVISKNMEGVSRKVKRDCASVSALLPASILPDGCSVAGVYGEKLYSCAPYSDHSEFAHDCNSNAKFLVRKP